MKPLNNRKTTCYNNMVNEGHHNVCSYGCHLLSKVDRSRAHMTISLSIENQIFNVVLYLKDIRLIRRIKHKKML